MKRLAPAFALLACSGNARPCPEVAHPAKEPAPDLFGSAPVDAAASGAGPFAVVAHGFASEGDRVGAFVDVPTNACALVLAAGSSALSDVDAFAFADDGATLGADESPLPRAAFVVCPPHPDRIYVSAKVVSGAGSVAIGTAIVPPEKAALVARAVHARTLGDDSGRLDAWPGLEAKAHARRKRLGSRWEDVRRLAVPLDPRAPTRTTLEIEPRRCIDVLVTPSEEIVSLDLAAEDEAGRVVARGEQDGRDRTLVLCSLTGDEVTIAMRPRGAPGAAGVIIGASTEGAESELSESVRVDRLTATRPLSEERAALATLLAASGMAEPLVVGAGTAKVGSRAAVDTKLRAGCARIDVIAGAPLGPVSAALWDTAGTLLAESEGGARATLYACGLARDAHLDVEAVTRPGPFTIELRSLASSPATLSAHPLAASRLLGRVFGAEPVMPAGLERTRAVHLSPASLVREPIELEPHTCLEVAAALDMGGSGLELRLVDAASNADTITRGRFVAADRACADAARSTVTAELRLTTGEADALLMTRDVGP